jgi:hypothetical protein
MALKSAWELAMERAGDAGPKLSAEQKARLAELDKIYTAKIAELEITEKPKIAAAAGDPEKARQLADHFHRRLQKLRTEWEQKKEEVRQGK